VNDLRVDYSKGLNTGSGNNYHDNSLTAIRREEHIEAMPTSIHL
jgi:hypothetical protein